MMKENNPFIPNPEFSMILTYDDEKIKEIDIYYHNLLNLLSLSGRLSTNEKLGQHAFITKEWANELSPLLKLISIHIYN